VDIFRQEQFDLVVTVCDSAAETCPVWLGPGKRVHLGFRDPATASGSTEYVLGVFRQVRDEIAQQIPDLLQKYIN
jgi:arsenate reductase